MEKETEYNTIMKMMLMSILLIALCVVHPGVITCLLALVSCVCTMIMMLGSTLCGMLSLPVVLVVAIVWLMVK